ncbi:membrane protein [Clostridium carboxidivorans P7]|uniref:YbaK/prolyl-tRNA synthetase n=1 Tax=Clostridium carboxidivorans P7 TaxID=536227 RepID=C6Q1A5_9CLOT|nr:YbaK/EbsC family protein [Clostridium carboxidivorans]AKN30776.1 membrane protein [Clostridium carboxidivorans P7]EET84714.1 YbaK/prolyl-tRNA synthetase [Clostridium carboxidivorans P7]EFG88515.1 YbaK/prolyl-tRNA synthetase-associated domain protein [Clostridium carboxidivorans P7]
MSSNLKKSAQKVQTVLNEFGFELNVVELSDSTRTAQEAANTIGCTVSQIAKSLIFKGKSSQKPILIIASGTNRVNEKVIKEHIGEKLQKADADFVLEHTGFAIGGIPPIGHKDSIITLIDEDLMQYDEIWAAAGTPNAVFKLTPKILVEITKGDVISIK